MNVIIKPAGLALLIAAMTVLGAVAFSKRPAPKRSPVSRASTPSLTTVTAGPPSGRAMLPVGLQDWNDTGPLAENKKEVLLDNSAPFPEKKYLRFTITKVDEKAPDAHQIMLTRPYAVNLPAGHRCVTRFWGRSQTNTTTNVRFQQAGGEYWHELDKRQTLTPQWRLYEIPFRTEHDCVKTSGMLIFQPNIAPGVIEIADPQVYDLSN